MIRRIYRCVDLHRLMLMMCDTSVISVYIIHVKVNVHNLNLTLFSNENTSLKQAQRSHSEYIR